MTIAPPPGTSSEAVLERTIEAEQILIGIDEVELVQSSIPGEGDAGFQTIVAAQSGRPANSARITVVLDDSVDLTEAVQGPLRRPRAGEDRRLRRRGLAGRRLHARTTSTSSSRATTPTRSRPPTRRSSRPCPTTPTCSTSSPTCPPARPRSRSRPIPTRRSWSASPRPRSPRTSARPSSARTATRIVLDEDGAGDRRLRPGRPGVRAERGGPPRAAGRHGGQGAAGDRGHRRGGRRPRARSPASTRRPRRPSRPRSPTSTPAR